MTLSYLLDGKAAQGEEYLHAIDSLPLPNEDLRFVLFTIRDRGTLLVFRDGDGFLITDERPDGSAWTSPAVSKERVKNLVGLFLAGRENWRESLDWKVTTHRASVVWWKALRILLIGAVLIAIALWLTGYFKK